MDEFMTLPRLDGFNKHWSSYPPAHVSIAAYTGIGKQSKGTAADDAEFDMFMASMPEMRKVGPDGR